MTSFWQALKTMFITIGNPHHNRKSKSNNSTNKSNNTLDYSTSIIDDSYLSNTIKSSEEQQIQSQQQQPIQQQKESIKLEQPPNIFIDQQQKEQQGSQGNGDYMDERDIQWPMWAQSIGNRVDVYPINRNGMDIDSLRHQNGFKGRNYVYQDRKFFSKYYWKGYSSLIADSSNNVSNQPFLLSSSSMTNLSSSQFSLVGSSFEDRMLIGVVYWSDNCEGPPGCVHGGALATLFDDSMACCIRYYYNNNYDDEQSPQQLPSLNNEDKDKETDNNNNTTTPPLPQIESNTSGVDSPPQHQQLQQVSRKYAVTGNLSVNYKKFVPLNSVTLVETRVEKREGKKIYVRSTIKDQSGAIRAEATAIWIVININARSSSSSPSSSFPSSPALSSR